MSKVIKFRINLVEDEDQIRVSFEADKGKMVFFALQSETKIKQQWIPVVRYDTAHSDKYPCGHRDDLHPNPAKNKKIDLRDLGISSLNEAYTYAYNDLKVNWEKYKKLYLNRLKKL